MDEATITQEMDALVAIEPAFAEGRLLLGDPPPRHRTRGYGSLLRTIVSQQLSTKASASIWGRLEQLPGDIDSPLTILQADPQTLRDAGLSWPKVGYAQSLATLVADGSLPVDNLPADDEEAIALLTSVKGLGRWSAEVYLLFAEGRPDILPAGDLALRIEAGRYLWNGERPSEKALRERALGWRPHRGVAALFLWHSYHVSPL